MPACRLSCKTHVSAPREQHSMPYPQKTHALRCSRPRCHSRRRRTIRHVRLSMSHRRTDLGPIWCNTPAKPTPRSISSGSVKNRCLDTLRGAGTLQEDLVIPEELSKMVCRILSTSSTALSSFPGRSIASAASPVVHASQFCITRRKRRA